MLTDNQINKIADHAFSNPQRPHRFNSERYGASMNIENQQDLKKAIERAADDPKSKFIDRSEGGHIIHQKSNNFTVIADGQGGGTALRDKRFDKEFDRLVRQENKIRQDKGIEPAEVKQGPVAREQAVSQDREAPSKPVGANRGEHQEMRASIITALQHRHESKRPHISQEDYAAKFRQAQQVTEMQANSKKHKIE